MTEPPKDLTDRPDETVDATDLLSHVLGQIRLTGGQVRSHALSLGSRLVLAPETAHLCIVTQGALRIDGPEQGSILVEREGLVLLPHDADHLRLTAADAPTTVVACLFQFDSRSLRDMMLTLPDCIHIKPTEAAGWLEGIVHFLLLEAGDIQPGGALMVSRLIDLAVIRTLRSWIHRGPASGWFGGLSDPRIANALKAIHARPMQRLSIEALAGIAGMSRSSFCQRFAALVGRSPLRYQNEHRLALARDLLAKGNARVGEIGLGIGYESEAAFSRAYKALFGRSPRTEHKRHGAIDEVAG